MYNFGTGDWDTVLDYPYGGGMGIYYYDMMFIPETSSYLVIGGFAGDSQLAQIARLKDGTWTNAGQLDSGRMVSFLIFRSITYSTLSFIALSELTTLLSLQVVVVKKGLSFARSILTSISSTVSK